MSGYTFGVPHVMNSADSRTRAPKTLVVVAAAAVLAGIGGAGGGRGGRGQGACSRPEAAAEARRVLWAGGGRRGAPPARRPAGRGRPGRLPARVVPAVSRGEAGDGAALAAPEGARLRARR